MKLIQKQIGNRLMGSVLARRVRIPCFDEQWHFHQELELIFLIKSKGIRFVGDNISEFSDNELVLTGPNLPHLYRNDPKYSAAGNRERVEVIIIQFLENFLGNDFLNVFEAEKLRQLFISSKRGILFGGEENIKAIRLIKKIPEKRGMSQLIDFITILNLLSESENHQLISSINIQRPYKESENERLSNVSCYLMDHYQENISLSKVADVANMSPNAFCRYFKKRTNRTLIQFLDEIRIGQACKILIDEKVNISDVSLMSGFNSLTLFNRKFKYLMHMNPREYRNQHQEEKS
jgi:AraC-like DNA-binding protein